MQRDNLLTQPTTSLPNRQPPYLQFRAGLEGVCRGAASEGGERHVSPRQRRYVGELRAAEGPRLVLAQVRGVGQPIGVLTRGAVKKIVKLNQIWIVITLFD